MKNLIGGAVSVVTLAFLLTGAGAASAMPYPGPYIRPAFLTADLDNRPLERVDHQLVRGDDLTGAGVRAPSHIPVVGAR